MVAVVPFRSVCVVLFLYEVESVARLANSERHCVFVEGLTEVVGKRFFHFRVFFFAKLRQQPEHVAVVADALLVHFFDCP